jgi:Zn-finger nucleic acid-binding protein
MKLVACPRCHAQYDVADVLGETVTCPCGATFPAKAPAAVEAAVTRCAACGALVGDEERTCSYCQATVTREPAPTGPVCPECYARNPERALHCTACGVAFLPQPVRKTGELLECPICPGVQLAARSLGGLWVDECPMCLGLWAPGDVMDRLIDRVRERRRQEGPPPSDHVHRKRRSRWQARIAYRKCPVCSGAMQRKNFAGHSGVVVDWCGSHGTWLDTHEMEDIAAFVLEGGLQSTLPGSRDGDWSLPADPAKAAAVLAAEQLLAEERARSRARAFPLDDWGQLDSQRVVKGIGDLFAKILK